MTNRVDLPTHPEARANALLIAASQKMLDALEFVKLALVGDSLYAQEYEAVCAAIAEAKGGDTP